MRKLIKKKNNIPVVLGTLGMIKKNTDTLINKTKQQYSSSRKNMIKKNTDTQINFKKKETIKIPVVLGTLGMIKKNTDTHINKILRIQKTTPNIPVVLRTLGMLKKNTDIQINIKKKQHPIFQ